MMERIYELEKKTKKIEENTCPKVSNEFYSRQYYIVSFYHYNILIFMVERKYSVRLQGITSIELNHFLINLFRLSWKLVHNQRTAYQADQNTW